MDPKPEDSTSWTMPLECVPTMQIRAFIVDAADQPFTFFHQTFKEEILLDEPAKDMSFAEFLDATSSQIFAWLNILDPGDLFVSYRDMSDLIYIQAAYADGRFSTILDSRNWRRIIVSRSKLGIGCV